MLLVGSMLLSDTPNSLVQRGRRDDARRILTRIRGTDNVDIEYEDICEAVRIDQTIKTNPYRTICQRRYWPQLIITVMIPMFQQLTGINAIMFYAPQLFESVGQSAEDALLATVITGAVNVGSTIVAILAVDRWVWGFGSGWCSRNLLRSRGWWKSKGQCPLRLRARSVTP
jgi:hypothetical protein